MPKKADKPIILLEVNIWQIAGFNVDAQLPRIEILIQSGRQSEQDVETTDNKGKNIIEKRVTTTWFRSESHSIGGQEMLERMMVKTGGGALYDEIKTMLYACAVEKGWIPADAK